MSTTESTPAKTTTMDMRREYLFAHEEARKESYRRAQRANGLAARGRRWGRATMATVLATIGTDLSVPANTLAEKVVGWTGIGVTLALGGMTVKRQNEAAVARTEAAEARQAADVLLTAEIVTAAAEKQAPAAWARHQLLRQTLPELIDPESDYPMPADIYAAAQPVIEQFLPQDAA